jgi:hypothetical protein
VGARGTESAAHQAPGPTARSSDLALQLVAERLSNRDSSGSPAFDPYPGHVAEGVAFCAAEAPVACGPRAVPAILGQLEKSAGREMAAQALARIGARGRTTIDALLEHARCDDWMTALALARALEAAGASPEDWERLLGDPATARVPLAVEWPSEPPRRLRLAPDVLRLLPLPALRGHAARWLGELGRDAPPEVAAALESALRADLDVPPGSNRVIREALQRVRGER